MVVYREADSRIMRIESSSLWGEGQAKGPMGIRADESPFRKALLCQWSREGGWVKQVMINHDSESRIEPEMS